jgi:TonB-linked SusC/RagA family outer membrane protein
MRQFAALFVMLFLSVAVAFAQDQVKGKVAGLKDGVPLAGISVKVRGTNMGTSTGSDGSFVLTVSSSDVMLEFSGAGFLPKTVEVKAGETISVSLELETKILSDVVVTTALGIKRQSRELGYSTATVKSEQLNQAAVINPATGLAAKVSGVDIRLADNGVNPQVKVTFRGSRSITGNNTALIVVDGVPVDQTYLANLNPSDIQDVTILKGPSAAALYGIDASNGVMVITTKKVTATNKGKGKFSLNYSNTISFESISYFPKLQDEYSAYGGESPGPQPNPPGGANATTYFVNPFSGLPNTVPFENEDYGAPYNSLDFSLDSVPIGITSTGQYIYTPYRDVPNGKEDFFQTGVADQNKLSGSFGEKWGGIYFSGEHTDKEGIVPKDTYARNGGRVNGDLNVGKFSASGGISYNNTSTDIAGNSYDQYRPVYWNVLNQAPSTDLKTISNTNLLQYNQGFINAYFPNPWVQVNDSRSKNSTNQLISNLQLNYKITDWLAITARGGYSRTGTDAPSYIDSIVFPSFLSQISPGNYEWFTGSYYPGNQGYQYEHITDHYSDANGDLFLTVTKKMDKFKFNLIVGANARQRSSFGEWYSNQVNEGNVIGQNFVPAVYTKVTNPDGSAYALYNYNRNDQAVYADLTVGYSNWLFLHGSFRNDWVSVLDPQNRSFNYPAIDLSGVLSDKIAVLKKSNTISFLKVRVGYAGTGNVSLDDYTDLGVMGNIAGGSQVGGFSTAIPTYGAYRIYPTVSVGTGYPFPTGGNSYSQSYSSVKNGLAPEKTKSVETGFEIGLFKNRIDFSGTYYDQISTNQILNVPASGASGIANFLTNSGEIDNSGVELDLNLNPLLRINDFRFSVDANFTYQNSEVVNINGGTTTDVLLNQINYGTTILGGIYASPGKGYPEIKATDFYRDPQGHIIVDAKTGLPSINPNPVDAGSANYKYFVGLSPKFTYKGFSLTAVFDYRAGAKILNEEANVLDFAGVSTSDAVNRQAFVIPGSVINTGTATNPNYLPNTNTAITSGFGGAGDYWWTQIYGNIGMPYVTSADFIKLREVALTYNFPAKIFASQKFFKALSITAIGRNLFMWRPKTNIWSDPEFSTEATGNAVGYTTEFQTPPTRVISFGIDATIF